MLMHSSFLCMATLSHYFATQILCSVTNRPTPAHIHSRRMLKNKENRRQVKMKNIAAVAVKAVKNIEMYTLTLYVMIKQ